MAPVMYISPPLSPVLAHHTYTWVHGLEVADYHTQTSSTSTCMRIPKARRQGPDMGNGQDHQQSGNLDIQTALDIARTPNTEVDPVVTKYLDSTVEGVWERIRAEPHSYLLNKDEFAIFNFYRAKYQKQDKDITEAAVARFWQHHGSTT